MKTRLTCLVLAALVSAVPLHSQAPANQTDTQESQGVVPPTDPSLQTASAASAPPAGSIAPTASTSSSNSTPQQPKRILGIVPNYRSVTADAQLPRLTVKGKFALAAQDSFDYSAFILSGILAGSGEVMRAVPQFGQGPRGYGRYYWHYFADQTSGNFLTEGIVPSLTHEDPRYYTLGHGTFLHRAGYSVSRLVITRTDSNHHTFNVSEILGNGISSSVSSLYYPGAERTWTRIGQRWAAQVTLDGLFNIFKEFWPDISAGLHLH